MGSDARATPPSADANFEEFATGLADFLPAVQDGFQCIVDLAKEANTESLDADSVIAMLTGSLAGAPHDVLVLCLTERRSGAVLGSKERRGGAVRLLPTPFEKFLYPSHISRHPESAQDFLMFDAIQIRALLTGIEDQYNHKIIDPPQT